MSEIDQLRRRNDRLEVECADIASKAAAWEKTANTLEALLCSIAGALGYGSAEDPERLASGDELVREVTALREKVRALEADNAALANRAQELFDAAGVAAECMDYNGHRDRLLTVLSKPQPGSTPGAALLAEMDALCARNEEAKAAHLLLDRAGESPVQPNIAERVRNLLGKYDALANDRDALRARVAELEVERDTADSARALMADRARTAEEEAKTNAARAAERNDFAARLLKAESERDAALAKADSAREEALDEALSEVLDEVCTYFDANPGGSPLEALVTERIRALKSQPARRMLDAEEVARAMRDLEEREPCASYPVSIKTLRLLAMRLGLSLEDPKP